MNKITALQFFNIMSVIILMILTGLFVALIAYAQGINPKDTEYIGMLIIAAAVCAILLLVQMIATVRSFMYPNN